MRALSSLLLNYIISGFPLIAMASSDPADLAKLTVAQLKALCKERKISGYSKLSKPALIQKLGDVNPAPSEIPDTAPAAAGSSGGSARSSKNAQGSSSASVSLEPALHLQPESPHSCARNAFSPSGPLGEQLSEATVISHPLEPRKGPLPAVIRCLSSIHSIIKDPPGAPTTTTSPPSRSTAAAPRPSVTVESPSDSAVPAKRRGTAINQPQSKKAKITPACIASNRTSVDGCSRVLPQPIRGAVSSAVPHPTSSASNSSSVSVSIPTSERQHTSLPKVAKRFKPLVGGGRPQHVPLCSTASRLNSSSHVHPVDSNLAHFDFPPPLPVPALQTISLPPPLSQRKRVQRWAVILSGLDDASRRQCALVSRNIRYAVYLSAGHIIDQQFRGERARRDMKPFSSATTNFWPYLRAREQEAREREGLYARSFLGPLSAAGRAMSVSSLLWGSPDHDKQASIAARFVLTSFWFAVSIGGRRSEDWLCGTVVDAQEVVPQEIWVVVVQDRKSSRTTARTSRFYILESTCEVIGSRPGAIPSGPSEHISLRVDWSAFIERCSRKANHNSEISLMSNLRWANHEEYDRGISKLWRRRIAQEGNFGLAKSIVAQRYIFACVVANSVSGSWMSATEMAQDFAGLPNRHAVMSTKPNGEGLPVNLYLPATHHVESVHFTTSSKSPLHPALAVVQTPAREYFVLRDNGFEVGCEDEGVVPLWMEILGCNSRGTPTTPGASMYNNSL